MTLRSNVERMDDRLISYDILRLRADNPGLLTLSGTNTWVVGRDPAYVVDPGPMLELISASCSRRFGRAAVSAASS